MLEFALSLLFLIAIGLLIRASSAKDIRLDWKPPFDTYEAFDDQLGRLRRPYLTLDPCPDSDESWAFLPLSVAALFPWPSLWRLSSPFRRLRLQLDDRDLPEGLRATLSTSMTKAMPSGRRRGALKHRLCPDVPFFLCLEGALSQPVLVTLTLTASSYRSGWPFPFFARPLSTSARLRFFIGPELGSVWMGFDPGTSGSCLAAGVHGSHVIVEQDPHQQDRITPSLIVFGPFWNKEAPPAFKRGVIPASCCVVGERAQTGFGFPGTASFQSFKRFLGFREPIRLTFPHGELEFEGKDLSQLLVRHVYDTFERYLRRQHPEIADGNGRPARCVVAIPNTFTLTQAQAMRRAVADVGKFSEVRCLTEAEAVFFYHLSRLREIPKERPRTVMVFDMGGSTMNTTILRFLALDLNGERRYKVEVLSRMGYGLGGDAIDYYLVRILCRVLSADLGERFHPYNPFDEGQPQSTLADLKQRWNRAAGFIKRRHAALCAQGERLSAEEALLEIIQEAVFQGELDELHAGPEFLKLFENATPVAEHPLHSQPELLEGVFLPLDELVREVVRNAEGVQLDAVIYSGRSCRFPSITERVRDALRKEGQSPREIPLPDQDLKSAVARGCCWYGLNHAGILVSAPTTSASFGFRHTAEIGHTDFIGLIPAGTPYDSLRGPDEIHCARGEHPFDPASTFAFDNRQLIFYQVMGSPNAAFSEGQRHRTHPLLMLPVRDPVQSVAMQLRENDTSEHTVEFQNQAGMTRTADLSELSLREHVDEHSSWFLGRRHYDLR